MAKIGYQNFTFNRYEMYQETPEYLLSANRGEIAAPNLGMEIVNTSQVFTDGGIPGGKIGPVIDSGNAGLSSMGTSDISVRIWAGADFEHRSTAPFRVMRDGDVVANSITITGGTLNYGKTSFTDSANAGYYIGSEGIYIGDVGDASQLKYTIADGTFNFVGTVSDRSTLTIANAIDASGNLVTDIINSKLDSSAKTILADFNFGSSDYAGGVKSGDITWNTTTGAITGGSGVVVYRNGIVGATGGVTTFSIDATTGAAIFAGQVTSTSGAIGGWTLGGDSLTASSGAVGLSSATTGGNDIRFWAGDATPANAPFRVYEDGSVFMSSATIAGVRLFETVVDPAGDGDYTKIADAIAAGKKSIFLRKGIHILEDNLTISHDTMIIGENREETIIQSGISNGASDYQIRVTGHYSQLRNFTKTNVGGGSAAIYVTGNSCVIDNVTVKNYLYAYVKGIHTAGAYTVVANCECVGDNALYSTGNNGLFLNNIFKMHAYYGVSAPVVFLNGRSSTFKDNYVWGACADATAGIVTITAHYLTVVDNVIEGVGTNGLGIYMASDNTIISGNKIEKASAGIRIQSGYTSQITNNILQFLSAYGIQLGYSSATDMVTVDGNVITSVGSDGIQVRNCYDCSIINNIIEYCANEGIDHISGQFQTSNISNNNIKNCNSHGIWSLSSSTFKYNNVTGNSVCYNGGRGFYIQGSYNNIVSNITTGNTTANYIYNPSGNTQYNIS